MLSLFAKAYGSFQVCHWNWGNQGDGGRNRKRRKERRNGSGRRPRQGWVEAVAGRSVAGRKMQGTRRSLVYRVAQGKKKLDREEKKVWPDDR